MRVSTPQDLRHDDASLLQEMRIRVLPPAAEQCDEKLWCLRGRHPRIHLPRHLPWSGPSPLPCGYAAKAGWWGAMSLSVKEHIGPCYECGGGKKGRRGGGYSSQCKAYNLRLSCADKLRVESWQASCLNIDISRTRELQTTIPTLTGSPKYLAGARDKSVKKNKYSKLAVVAAQLVIAALLGNPTAIIARIVQGFMM